MKAFIFLLLRMNVIKQNHKTYFIEQMDFIPFQLNVRGKLLDLSQPVVMAIINVTPDSFYSGSRFPLPDEALKTAEKALHEGATILDIGAYSTRPSAQHISEKEERARLDKPLKIIRERFPDAVISLDTFRASIAHWASKNYAIDIINDISGGTLDDAMFAMAAELQLPYILTHTRGTPQTMQQQTNYKDMMAEMLDFFQQRVTVLTQKGVKDIIIDPGFGFAKTLDQNYELLAKMDYFKAIGFPLLCGISRKSMIYRLLDINPEDALNGTTVLNVLALQKGAAILRVHDVKAAIETIKIYTHFNSFQQHGITYDWI